MLTLLLFLGELTSLEYKIYIYLNLHYLQAWHCLHAFHVYFHAEYFHPFMVSAFLIHLSLMYLPRFFG